jgi:hypothetical protein
VERLWKLNTGTNWFSRSHWVLDFLVVTFAASMDFLNSTNTPNQNMAPNATAPANGTEPSPSSLLDQTATLQDDY